MAIGTAQDVLRKYALEQLVPPIAGRAGLGLGGRVGPGCGGVAQGIVKIRSSGMGDDEVAQGGYGGEDTVVGELMLARR